VTEDSDEVYVLSLLPKWAVGIVVAIVFGPLTLVHGYAVYVLWDFDRVRQSLLVLVDVGAAGLCGWWLSRTTTTIRISPDEVRWPLGFKLRREDVEYYKVVRRFGMEWVHIQRKRGFAYRPFLNLTGGQEYRQRLLEWLGQCESSGSRPRA